MKALYDKYKDRFDPSDELYSNSNLKFELVTDETIMVWRKNNLPQITLYSQASDKIGKNRGFQRFDREDKTYVLIASGIKPSGGYSIDIKGIIENGTLINVYALDLKPKEGPAAAVFTNPHILISIKRTNKDIQLDWIS